MTTKQLKFYPLEFLAALVMVCLVILSIVHILQPSTVGLDMPVYFVIPALGFACMVSFVAVYALHIAIALEAKFEVEEEK